MVPNPMKGTVDILYHMPGFVICDKEWQVTTGEENRKKFPVM